MVPADTLDFRQKDVGDISQSLATVDRTIAALIAAGKIEHRGSKKTGGYYCK